jgi:predicted amidohydrolase YtcJ
MQPDLIVVADRIHVLGTHAPVRALLVREGRVAALGSEEEVRAAAKGGFSVERLDGATVTPGLTDAHVHLTLWALARRRVDLNAARTLEDGVAAVAAAGGEGWIRGLGWDVHRWGRFPSRHDLDAVLPGGRATWRATTSTRRG